jgi:hypothetical protein
MKRRDRVIVCIMAGFAFAVILPAQEPIIPPSVAKIAPAGMQRGSTATFDLEGRNLANATGVMFDAPGISGKLAQIADVSEKITGPRAGEDLEAQVPLGRKQTAKLEITVAKDAAAGIHQFRVKTPLGTSNMTAFAVGALPEVRKREKSAMDSSAAPQLVELPATVIGSIDSAGEKDAYQFEGKGGEEIVFRVLASQLGSKLASMLVLSDASGKVLAAAGQSTDRRDAELHSTLAESGTYTITVADRDDGGGAGYFYRLDAGDLPYIASVFPLGVRAGHSTEVNLQGVNLGGTRQVKLQAPASAEGWTTIPLDAVGTGIHPINEVRLAVGSEPEIDELEPNDNVAQAQRLSLPVTINGHIDGGSRRNGNPDEDYFRFRAKKGERISIDVAAARLGSALDSVIEVLDAQGNSIPRATIRCLNETTTTLADRDSRTENIRLVSTSGLREGDYLMVGDELDQIDFIPDQPDADTILKSMGGLRVAYLGTTSDVHAVNTPVYKAQILPPDAEFPSNGLPVFRLSWRNDDGGPGYGADSMLDFIAPTDAEYILHVKDVRSTEGPDFAYRLTIRDELPDFRLSAEPANPNIPSGGSTTVEVSVDAMRGFDGPIEIVVKGLPPGITASPATIPPGQISTLVVLSAAPDATSVGQSVPIQVVGHAKVDGRDLTRTANKDGEKDEPLQLASISPAPDVIVTTDSKDVVLQPGKDAKVTLHVERRNGFKGRVPCLVQNLPPGVRVVNVGLNGVLVTEAQTSRTFTLHAEDWAQPIQQPIYVVGMVESNSPTMHPSAPLALTVTTQTQTASIDGGRADEKEQPASEQLKPHR